jgi:cyclase
MRNNAIKALVLAAAFAGLAFGQRAQSPADGEIHILPVQGNIYMLVGSASNIAVSIGADGAVVIDSGSAQMAPKVVAAIDELLKTVNATTTVKPCLGCAGLTSPYFNVITASPGRPKPIRYVINTTSVPHHVGGNEVISKAGQTFTGGNIDGLLKEDVQEGAAVLAHENVLLRMSEAAGARPSRFAVPQEVYNREQYKLYRFFNGEAVQLYHQPAAITDGDSIVHFRYSDVIATGDVFVTTGYPMIDLEKGGSIQGVIDALNRILDLCVTENNMQGGTMIIPGHGRLADSSDVAHYRGVVTIIRDRVQALVDKEMTLAQVKASKPTFDYDRRYSTNEWTGDMFVEAIYKSLKK